MNASSITMIIIRLISHRNQQLIKNVIRDSKTKFILSHISSFLNKHILKILFGIKSKIDLIFIKIKKWEGSSHRDWSGVVSCAYNPIMSNLIIIKYIPHENNVTENFFFVHLSICPSIEISVKFHTWMIIFFFFILKDYNVRMHTFISKKRRDLFFSKSFSSQR